MIRKVILEFYNSSWKTLFNQEADTLKNILGKNALDIFHIGSTSIEGILSKPIIDILIVVEALAEVDVKENVFVSQGYLYRGEFGVEGRRYIVGLDESKTHHRVHVHIFEKGHPEIKRHLFFRDYLRANPEWAKKYELLKVELRDKYDGDRHKYQEGKKGFCDEVLGKMELEKEQGFYFQPLREEDFILLEAWLNRPHVRKWWKARDSWKEEYRHDILKNEKNAVSRFIALYGDKPIGFIQYYWAYEWLKDYPSDVIGLDLYIGEEDYLGQGLGKGMIKSFVEYLKRDSIKKIIVDPAPSNKKAIACFEAVGFVNKGKVLILDENVILMALLL